MKKILVYLILIFTLILTSCSSAEKSCVTLSIENNVLPVGTKSVVAKWANNTNDEIFFGYGVGIEKKESGEWVKLEQSETYIVEDILIGLSPKGEKEVTYDLTAYYGKDLPVGEYRIRASFCLDETLGENCLIYAEFKIE